MSREQNTNTVLNREELKNYSQDDLKTLRQWVRLEFIRRKRSNKKRKEKQKVLYRPGGRVRYWTLYVLLLKDNKYYVGVTAQRVEVRYEQHCGGKGSKWTKLHRPLGIVEHYKIGKMCESDAVHMETDKTMELIEEHGVENVRGGSLVMINPAKVERTYQRLLNKRNNVIQV